MKKKKNRFWRNLFTLIKALAEEESICISATPKQRLSKKEINSRPEIIWPEGEITWDELCAANSNYSKEEIRKAIGKKMEQHRKVII